MHGLVNVKSPNNISEWQMGFNSAFKGLNHAEKKFCPTFISLPDNSILRTEWQFSEFMLLLAHTHTHTHTHTHNKKYLN